VFFQLLLNYKSVPNSLLTGCGIPLKFIEEA
jgi:hypothetical protein